MGPLSLVLCFVCFFYSLQKSVHFMLAFSFFFIFPFKWSNIICFPGNKFCVCVLFFFFPLHVCWWLLTAAAFFFFFFERRALVRENSASLFINFVFLLLLDEREAVPL